MRLLALDQSIRASGWALFDVQSQSGYGGTMCKLRSGWFGAQAASDDGKLAAFIDHVEQLVADEQPAMLVWEKPSKFIGGRGGVQARTLVLTRLDQALQDICRRCALSYDTVAPGTWRAKVFGKGGGRLSRDEAKAWALWHTEAIGLPVKSVDEAEAICIGLWAATCSPVARSLLKEPA